MDPLTDRHSTARALFLVKIANGSVPKQVSGGELDGLRYFEIRLDGEDYWLAEHGLFTPPRLIPN